MRDPAELERILALLTARVAAQLRDEQILASTVTMKLRHDDFRYRNPAANAGDRRPISMRSFTSRPGALPHGLRGGARARPGSAAHRDRGHQPGHGCEEDLFEPPERSRLRQLTAAVDKVRGKFGFDAVTPATILELRQRRPKR